MTDIEKIETDLNAAIAGAGDDSALEDVRVRALGKKGQVNA
ncbi:MAG: phenylalanine--tRNA ligase subunit alpha, partial [Rhizobiales bacterium]|nr:phenylalanine--tRNA ligase subunit alpha [Hyphomicrobiales bacterium]